MALSGRTIAAVGAVVIIVAVLSIVIAFRAFGTSGNAPLSAWIQLLSVVIAALVGTFATWLFFDGLAKTKSVEAMQETIKIYKDQAEAYKHASSQAHERIATCEAERATNSTVILAKEQEIKELRARTDITSVLEALREVHESQRVHDQQLGEQLQRLAATGNDRYEKAASLMSNTLEYLAGAARDHQKSSEENRVLLVALTGAVDRMASRVLEVERNSVLARDAANEANTKIDTVIDQVDGRDGKPIQPPPPQAPKGRR